MGTQYMQRARVRFRQLGPRRPGHRLRGESLQVQLLTPLVTTPFQPLAVTRPINKNETHRLGSGGKEVDAIVPGSRPAWINQPEVRLVYQGRA
jgi:hypothetical protein